jgi:YidC/Oxa1 family membrane protein insertase
MQDQAKRLLLAVGLALLVMVAWNKIFSPPPSKPPSAGSASTTSMTTPTPPLVGLQKSQAGTLLDGRRPTAVAHPAVGPVIEDETNRIVLHFPNASVSFSERDAALVSWKLADPKYLHDPSFGEIIARGRGALLVNFARSTYAVPEGATWVGEKLSATEVRFRYESDTIQITKTFTVHPADYLVSLAVEVSTRGAGDAQQRLVITSFGFQDPKIAEGSQHDHARVFMSSTLAQGEISATPYKRIVEAPRAMTDIRWTGFDHPYLLVAIAPDPKVLHVEKLTVATGAPGEIQTDVLYPMTTVRAGLPVAYQMIAYIGPKYYAQLENADKIAGFSTGFKDTVDLGWFEVIGRPLLWLLEFFHGVAGNWGIAIILLTVLVKLATLYWTTKSMRSMKAMAVLGPKMKDLQSKYSNDKAKLQQETMALYKHHGVNPLAGCLPMLLQMPIWMALYRMLSSASELYLQPFVGGWIDDLTARDPLYVLPVVVTATMFLQSWLQPAAPAGDSAQQMQRKIMVYGMPLMFGIMGLFFPAGLTLYMFTNTLLSVFHSLYMNKFDKPSLAMAEKLKESEESSKVAAAAEAAKSSPSRGDGGDGQKRSAQSKQSVASRSNSKRKPNR